jgi:hypothetical protein
LVAALRKGIADGLATAGEEKDIPVILGPHRPWFISRPDLTRRVLFEMHPYVEAWVGQELTANNAYGFRLYRNGSQLMMHTDRAQTHVVSFILHIDSSEDAEPWPILIEGTVRRRTYDFWDIHVPPLFKTHILVYSLSPDFYGNTHEVILVSPLHVVFSLFIPYLY